MRAIANDYARVAYLEIHSTSPLVRAFAPLSFVCTRERTSCRERTSERTRAESRRESTLQSFTCSAAVVARLDAKKNISIFLSVASGRSGRVVVSSCRFVCVCYPRTIVAVFACALIRDRVRVRRPSLRLNCVFTHIHTRVLSARAFFSRRLRVVRLNTKKHTHLPR